MPHEDAMTAAVVQRLGATSYRIDARGMIRFTHEGWDETADGLFRRESLALLSEWRDAPNPN